MLTGPEFFDLVTVTAEHPRSGEGDMALLGDGRLFFAYGDFQGAADNARASIVSRYSADQGRTWTDPETLIHADEARENVMSVSLLRLHSGGLLLFYLRKDGLERCQAWMRRSDDDTGSWGEAVCCTPAARYHVIVNNCAVQLRSGRVLLPYEACDKVWTTEEHLEAGVAYSDDEGRTWRHSNLVYSPRRGAMEPRVVELSDGRLWMLMRTDRGVIDQSFSFDEGETWSRPVSSGVISPQAPFVFTRLPHTGDLLLMRNPYADLSLGHQGLRTPLRCAVSSDEGCSWRHQQDLEPDTNRTYCYLSITFIDDLAIMSYYVGSLARPLESLRIARVPLSWFYS